MTEDARQTDKLVTEQTRIWNSPGAPNIGHPADPGRTGLIKADITRQYVAASPNQWMLNLARVLPFAIDSITTDFGDDLYERMLFDAIVSSSITTFKAAILEDGIGFEPAVLDKDVDGYDQAVKLSDEIGRALDESDIDLDDWIWNQLDALPFGNKVTEITYQLDRVPSGRQQYVLSSLRCKPRRSTGFVVDSYRNLIGLMGLIPGVAQPVYVGSVLVEPSKQPNLLPREKFAVLSHRSRDDDPRGVSILRPCYTTWNLKMQLWTQYQKWLTQFASPSLIGYTPQEAMALPMVDALGNPLLDTSGNPLMAASPEEAMLNVLTKLASGTAAVFPYGSEVKPIEMRGQGQPFQLAFRMLNEEMVTAIKGQTMTTLGQSHGTQALGKVQENVFETLVHQAKMSVVRMIRRDILRWWVRYNHGAQAAALTPRVTLGTTEQQDFMGELSALAQAGYTIDPSQFPGLDQRLNLPDRAPNWNQQPQPEVANTPQGGATQDGATQQQLMAKLKTLGITLDQPSAGPPPPSPAEKAALERQAA